MGNVKYCLLFTESPAHTKKEKCIKCFPLYCYYNITPIRKLQSLSFVMLSNTFQYISTKEK